MIAATVMAVRDDTRQLLWRRGAVIWYGLWTLVSMALAFALVWLPRFVGLGVVLCRCPGRRVCCNLCYVRVAFSDKGVVSSGRCGWVFALPPLIPLCLNVCSAVAVLIVD